MRVEGQREEDREARQMGAAAQDECAQEGATDHQRDQQQHGVHPRLVGVQADEGIERHQPAGDDGRSTSRRAPPPTTRPGRRRWRRPPTGRASRSGPSRRPRSTRAGAGSTAAASRPGAGRRGSRSSGCEEIPTEMPSSIQYGAESARRRSIAATATRATTAAATRTRRPDGRAPRSAIPERGRGRRRHHGHALELPDRAGTHPTAQRAGVRGRQHRSATLRRR